MDKYISLLSKVQIYELEEVSGDKLIIYNKQCYHIGEMLYDCIVLLKKGMDITNITSFLNEKYKTDFNDNEIDYVLNKSIDNIESLSQQKSFGVIDNIYVRKKLMDQKYIQSIAQMLVPLCDKATVIMTVAIFAVSQYLIFVLWQDKVSYISGYATDNPVVTIFSIYLTIPVIAFWHEFGHSAASLYWNIKPKEIGFGLYLVFPIFYTDVSDIWRLPRMKRIFVNFGGIYFQMILSILLSFVFLIIDNINISYVIFSIFISNLFMLTYAIIPFFRNDGYWIYSDFFHIANLSYRSKKYPLMVRNLLKNNKISMQEKLNILKSNWALFIYSICDTFLTMCMFASIFVMTIWNLAQIFQLSSYIGHTSTLFVIQKGLFIFITLSLNIYFLYRIGLMFTVSIKNKYLL